MAAADHTAIARHPNVKFRCVADVDLTRSEQAKKRFPELVAYQDWRELLDKEAKNLDSVNVSTPDHMHAPITMRAMQRGLHVYTQKPLTQTLHEARQLAKVAWSLFEIPVTGPRYRAGIEFVDGGNDMVIAFINRISPDRAESD